MTHRIGTASPDRLQSVTNEIAGVLRRMHGLETRDFGKVVTEALRRGNPTVSANWQLLDRARGVLAVLCGMSFIVRRADPSDDLLVGLDRVLSGLQGAPLARDLGIARADLFVANLNGPIGEVLDDMRQRRVSLAPILGEGEVLVGVFSERTLFDARVAHCRSAASVRQPLSALAEFCRIDGPRAERFAFIGPEAGIEAARRLFAEDLENERRVAALFVTEDAAPSSPVRRMIRPRDVLS